MGNARLRKKLRYMTIAEAALVLRVCDRTVRRWVASGRIRSVRPGGGRRLIPEAEIEQLVGELTK